MINKYLVAILILGFIFFYTSKHTTRKDIPVSIVVPVVNTPKESIVYTDYKEALEVAKKEKRLLLVILKSIWCKYCTILENDFDKLKIKDKFVICLLDIDDNKKLAKEFKYNVIPTSVVIDCSGTRNIEKSRKGGYIYDNYMDWLQSINHDN